MRLALGIILAGAGAGVRQASDPLGVKIKQVDARLGRHLPPARPGRLGLRLVHGAKLRPVADILRSQKPTAGRGALAKLALNWLVVGLEGECRLVLSGSICRS
jgi:hypothetical protein